MEAIPRGSTGAKETGPFRNPSSVILAVLMTPHNLMSKKRPKERKKRMARFKNAAGRSRPSRCWCRWRLIRSFATGRLLIPAVLPGLKIRQELGLLLGVPDPFGAAGA